MGSTEIVASHRKLGLPGGIIIAQSVPEEFAPARDRMEHSLADAINQAQTTGIRGKDVTPFLLDQLRLATDGESLKANRALIVSNARLAGQFATQLGNKNPF